jgi:serine/threonine-protein kinase
MRLLGTNNVNPEYVAVLDSPAGKRTLIRRVDLAGDNSEEAAEILDARLEQLKRLASPRLVSVVCAHIDDLSYYIAEDRCEQISLRAVIDWCIQTGQRLPEPVFLHIALQACRGLEALHESTRGSRSREATLHEALCPDALFLDREGNCRLGNYRLNSMGASWTTGSISMDAAHLAYLSPEQTTSRRLQPSSDIFSLATTLYELWSLKHMFLADSTLQTLQRIRTGQVTANLTDVRDTFKGLDRVLYRALSLNPRHRYQQVFVLKEDLRALMAGYSFVDIAAETARFIAPVFDDSESPNEPLESSSKSVSTASLLNALVAEHRDPAAAQDETDEEIHLLTLPEPSAEAEPGDVNDPEPVSEPDSEEDTAALIRDLSRRRATEEEYEPTHHLQPPSREEENSTSAISIVPLPMLPTAEDVTRPLVRYPEEAPTEVLVRPPADDGLGSDNDLDTTAVGERGDTVPIPRPISAPLEAVAKTREDVDAHAADIAFELPEPEQGADDSFSIYKPRSQALPMVMLIGFAVFVFCTGSLGMAAWLFIQTR